MPLPTTAAQNEHTTGHSKSSARSRLDEKLAHWRKNKYRTAAWFLLLGILGIFLPVIPGLLFLGIAFWLIFPKTAEKIWGDLKRKLAGERGGGVSPPANPPAEGI
ncbi:MAG: hypothetical protein ONB48_06230 [candidate division KSB1 bacterium]|nr:hypothetical protein [candidate division KSB1 bacterium]MDZ7273139.1 hypothetical protein [candidate division KSB1 bacterium]MDZ7285241.1 hypothetical protein [candidate division KSB1 bacterium]MDZ7298273.1 hypothetical protein [candidate division KSB1 bacterium]MDZ7306646.1 hypothetical protein [candidate division KSB1 bacterium]